MTGSVTTPAGLDHVFRPIRLGTMELAHRVVMGSMHMNLEKVGDGSALGAFYAERVAGGADLLVTGGIAVNRAGAGGPTYSVLNGSTPEEQAEAGRDADRLARAASMVHDAGGQIALQLFHAGRYAFEHSFGLRPVAPSAVFSRFSRAEPEAMSRGQIEQTIADFASAAATARDLGFDAVEIMGSEGYLINQYASPVTNRRDDEWGGDAERRMRFPLAVFAAVRDAVGDDFPIIVRTSGADLVEGASSEDEADALAVAYARAGADAVNVGIGWHESTVPTVQALVPHGMWLGVAARVRRAIRAAGLAAPVIGSNRLNSLTQAEELLAAGAVDLVSMARPFLADPAIVGKSRAGRLNLVNTCIACNEACLDRSFGEAPVSCMVNPRAGHELEFPVPSSPVEAGSGPRVAVVGAGPAGLQAAVTLAGAGHAVDLFEAGERIGGQFLLAGSVAGKTDFLESLRYFDHELARLGVRRLLNREASAADLAGYAHTVVATGVLPREVEIQGADSPHVLDYREAFRDPAALGDTVAIVGAGGIGVDLAHRLTEEAEPDDALARRRFAAAHGIGDSPGGADDGRTGRTVTIMRRTGRVGAGIGPSTRWAVLKEIRDAGVRTLTDIAYERITAEGIVITGPDGAAELVAADSVVIAAGQVPNDRLAGELAAAGLPHSVIGGARDASGLNAVRAFEDGLRVGRQIAELLANG